MSELGELPVCRPFQPGDPQIDIALEGESIAMFLPNNDLKAAAGTYNHLRAAAATICTSQLRTALPSAWQELHASDLQNEAGQPFRKLPRPLWCNRSFTSVSFRDVNVDAKTFVF